MDDHSVRWSSSAVRLYSQQGRDPHSEWLQQTELLRLGATFGRPPFGCATSGIHVCVPSAQHHQYLLASPLRIRRQRAVALSCWVGR